MQITKINTVNNRANTVQNNNGTTQPLYRQNKNNFDSVSFGAVTQAVETLEKKLPLMKTFPDIIGTIRLHLNPPDSSNGITIENHEEIKGMFLDVIEYIGKKTAVINEIMETTSKKDLPIAENYHDRTNPVNIYLYPDKSYDFRHNGENGEYLEEFFIEEGHLDSYSRWFKGKKPEDNYQLCFSFQSDGSNELDIAKFGPSGETKYIDMGFIEKIFGKGNIPKINTTVHPIRE